VVVVVEIAVPLSHVSREMGEWLVSERRDRD